MYFSHSEYQKYNFLAAFFGIVFFYKLQLCLDNSIEAFSFSVLSSHFWQLTICRDLATLHQEADTCVLISIEDEQEQQQELDSRKNGHVVSVIPKDEILRKTAQFDHFTNCPKL
jgi:hypothetical protein